jgi:hypothetical protein
MNVSRSKQSITSERPADNGEADPLAFPYGENAPADKGPINDADTEAAPDPFDPAALRITPELAATTGVKKVVLTIPCRKPHKSAFIRAHPDPEYRITTGTIELDEERGELYLVTPHLMAELAIEPAFRPRMLVTAITRQGALFLWPLNMPRQDGRVDEWTRTGLEAMQYATKSWVRVYANMTSGGYEVAQATGQLPDPEWPELTFREILRIAFRDRLINSLDHPVIRRLRGEV